MEIEWIGKGIKEKGIDRKTGKTIIEVNPIYFRPREVEFLQGDSSKAQKILGWKPKTTFRDLAKLMVEADLENAQREASLGHSVDTPKRFYIK